MIVWGGNGFYGPVYNSGGRYNPETDSWAATSTGGNVPSPRQYHTAVWTGREMIVWGGSFSDRYTWYIPLNSGGSYSPVAIGWVGNTLQAGKSGFPVILLYWAADANATSYNVRRCTAAGSPCIPAEVVATPTNNSYAEALDGVSYFYAVEAVEQCIVTP